MVGVIKPEAKVKFYDLICHGFANLVIAIGVFLCAIVVSSLREFSSKGKLPDYVIFAFQYVSVALIIVDGVFVCGTAVMLCLRTFQLFRKSQLPEMEARYPHQFSPLNDSLNEVLGTHIGKKEERGA